MAHNISIRENGFAEFAFTGNRKHVWHRLGQQLDENAPLNVWRVEAGMDWTVKEGVLRFTSISDDSVFEVQEYPHRKVLYRSDTGAPLSIVGDDFKVVQPEEVLEFFNDLITSHGMKMSTAGCLFDGRRFWALSDTGNADEVTAGDLIKSYLFFVTSVDGTLASCARYVSTRVVCHNTMQIAMNQGSKNIVRRTHKSAWDNGQAKIDLGLLSDSFDVFMSRLKILSECRMTEPEVKKFFKKTFYNPELEESEQGWGAEKKVNKLMDLYVKGAGAELAYGTAYGAFNAITNLTTHGTGRRNPDKQFWNAYYEDDKVKDQALHDLLKYATAET